MPFIEITKKDRASYHEFIQSHPLGDIHQTWEWGEFQATNSDRDRFWVFSLTDKENKLQASALIIRHKLPYGKSWLYCPRGPLIDYANPEAANALFAGIAKLAKAQKAIFLRFDPPVIVRSNSEQTTTQKALTRVLNAHPAHAHYQPESTLMLDLTLSPEELLGQMKPKGRYNIKVAQKHGVQIRVSENASKDGVSAFSSATVAAAASAASAPQTDLQAFYQLLQTTTSRDKFSAHSFNYYQNMLACLGQASALRNAPSDLTPTIGQSSPYAKLYLAMYQHKIVAGMIVTFFHRTATYYFGASASEYRNTMAPYLLQWQAILDAQKAGYHYYDFLGIAPENQPRHPWAGVTDFKLKFGGQRLNYLPAQEIVYQKTWYHAMKVAKKARSFLK